MRSLNSILDLSVEELDGLISTAKDIIANPEKYHDSCKYKKLAMQEVEDEFGFPVYSVVDVYDIIEYLKEDPKNAENVERIQNYLAVNGAKA